METIKRGGKRPRSGRKPSTNKLVQIAPTVTPDQAAWLRAQPEGISEVIRQAVDLKRFLEVLKTEAQAQYDFNRQEWPDSPGDAEDAVRTALECCSAELSMKDYADAVDAVGAGKQGFVAALAATLK